MSYRNAFGRLLADVAVAPRAHRRPHNVFWPMEGRAFERGLMVVGRAVNGWGRAVSRQELADPQQRTALVEEARQFLQGSGSCPLAWVGSKEGAGHDYNILTSPFWRLVRGLVQAEDSLQRPQPGNHWSSYVVWTNLCKVSPVEQKGGDNNPGLALRRAQEVLGAELLRAEVDETQPRRILVVSGRHWFEPFAAKLGLPVSWHDGLVVGTADHGDRRWVICERPERRGDQRMLDAVRTAFADRR